MPAANVRSWRCGLTARVGFAIVAGSVAVWAAFGATAVAADPPPAAGAGIVAAEAAAIRAAGAAYREALTKGDVAAIRRLWTADGDVVDGWGNVFPAAEVVGSGDRPADAVRPDVRVGETRLRLITPDVVLEDGSVDVVIPGTTTPLEGWFSAIWVKQGGEWKLAGIRESERPTSLRPDSLDDLEWMVGEWTLVPEDDAKAALPATTMSVRWDTGRMFLIRDVRLTSPATAAEPVIVDVQQRIGWDPLMGRIRSWSFSSDGTRGEATWFRDGNSWIAKGTTIQADGTQSTTVQIYSHDGQDRCTWRMLREPFASDDRIPMRATWVRGPKGGAK